MNQDRIAAILCRARIFNALDPAALDRMAPEVITRTHRKGDLIFSQGDPGMALYVVAAGMVKISLESTRGDEMILATLRPPELFGELAVIDEGPRTASARALEPTTLLAVTRLVFLRMLRENPALMDALHRSLGGLLRRSLQQASDLIFMDLPGRVAKLLLSLAGDVGRDSERGMLLDLNVTQSTLAGLVGGSRPSVNQILQSFQAQGYLELEGRKIIIKRPEMLLRRSAH
jgi:CRP/FNR family transcriptional regulator, cyclic AMP receptor protein